MDKRIFQFDPLIGCPFDDSEMKMVNSWGGFFVGDQVKFSCPPKPGARPRYRIQGKVVAIGDNAKFLDGDPFTAFAVRVGKRVYIKTHHDVYHVSNEMDTRKARILIDILFKIMQRYWESHHGNLDEEIFVFFEKAKVIYNAQDSSSLTKAIQNV